MLTATPQSGVEECIDEVGPYCQFVNRAQFRYVFAGLRVAVDEAELLNTDDDRL